MTYVCFLIASHLSLAKRSETLKRAVKSCQDQHLPDGVEIDVYFGGRWVEMLGAGMVHPNVLKNAGLDAEEYGGFAFGVGIDRLMMAKHGVPDVRFSYQGDLRFVNQF